MRTENLKKLLTGVVTTPESGSSYKRVITPRSGSFTAANGSSVAATDMSGTFDSRYIAALAAGNDMIFAAMFRAIGSYSVTYKAWSETAAYNTSSYGDQAFERHLAATYDSSDTPISASDYAMRGTDVPCTVSISNDTTITVTFSNAGESVLHANRIGLSARFNPRFVLLHIFAFDDIALAPGETKSITIQPDLD